MALIHAPSGNDGGLRQISKNRPPVRSDPDLGNSSHYSSDSCTADGNSFRQTITLPTQTSFNTRMRIIVISEEKQLTQRLRQALKDQSNRTATMELRQAGTVSFDNVINEYTPDLILVMPRGGYRQRFLVRQGQKLQSIPIEDIYYFYSEERFIFFRTRGNQKFLVDYRIEELEKMLDPLQFFRVNRSYLISINAIDQVYLHYGNRLKLITVLSTPKEIIVSRDRVPDFRAWMGE